MLALLSKHWWVFFVRGILAILFGLMAFAWPGLTLATLVILFGAWALVSGCFALFGAFSGKKEGGEWWVLLLQGLLEVAIGVLTFRQPGITAIAILWYLAFGRSSRASWSWSRPSACVERSGGRGGSCWRARRRCSSAFFSSRILAPARSP